MDEEGKVMRTVMRGIFVALLLLGVARIASAKCDPVNNPDDAASVASARAAADAACDCASAATHGTYVRCAAQAINGALDGSDAQHNRSCRGKAKKCYAKSSCGKSGFVTCYKTNARGRTTCAVKSDCTRCRAPAGGSACCGTNSSCCDLCTPAP
jgi:hypothetical protein